MANEASRKRFSEEKGRSYSNRRGGLGGGELGEYVSHHPASSVLVVFGIGFGMGVVLGSLIAQPSRPRWEEMGMAERLGRQILDAVSDVLPDPLARRMHS